MVSTELAKEFVMLLLVIWIIRFDCIYLMTDQRCNISCQTTGEKTLQELLYVPVSGPCFLSLNVGIDLVINNN